MAQFVCLVGVALSLAAQMIAAPAENYAGRTRLWIAVWAALFVCLIQVPKSHPKWGEIAVVALVGIAIASLFELSAERRHLPAHRPQSRIGRVFAWLLLPGWQSALLFYTPVALTLMFVAYVGEGFRDALLILPSAFALALLPRALVEFVPWHWFGRRRIACFALQIAFALLALGVGAACSSAEGDPTWPQLLPPFGFWNGLAWAKPDTWSPVAGALWAGALLILLVFRALTQLDAARAAARQPQA